MSCRWIHSHIPCPGNRQQLMALLPCYPVQPYHVSMKHQRCWAPQTPKLGLSSRPSQPFKSRLNAGSGCRACSLSLAVLSPALIPLTYSYFSFTLSFSLAASFCLTYALLAAERPPKTLIPFQIALPEVA